MATLALSLKAVQPAANVQRNPKREIYRSAVGFSLGHILGVLKYAFMITRNICKFDLEFTKCCTQIGCEWAKIVCSNTKMLLFCNELAN